MTPLIAGVLLDDGGRELVQILGGLLVAVLLLLLLAVATPIVLLAAPRSAHPPPAFATPATSPGATPGRPVAAVPVPIGSAPVDVARRYLGVKYVFGGTDPAIGLDCSGLVQLVYRLVGYRLPRTAQQQYAATDRVDQDQLQPGDLVFFARTYPDPHDWITHVGIYAGDGVQINAPTEGQVVSIQPVFSGFWGAHYAGAGRVRAG